MDNFSPATTQNELFTLKRPASKEDIQKLLEILNTTDDYGTLVKIFSLLAISLVSDNSFKDIIITCNAIYHKIRDVLIQKLPLKTAKTLNFVSAMLFINEEEVLTRKKSLILYAQNMIRSSGCLLEMCNLFISPMMHQETWTALCRSIAECCQNSHKNQTYCSHLISLCVKKCFQGDFEVLLPLKNLLSNYDRNVQHFLECNGILIFNKELMRLDVCMQLLDMLVQNIATEPLIALNINVNHHLQYYKRVHGTETRVGQWASVILHHLSVRLKGSGNNENNCFNEESMTKSNEATVFGTSKLKYDDTAKLLQNVVREIYQFNAINAAKQPTLSTDKTVQSIQHINIRCNESATNLKRTASSQKCTAINKSIISTQRRLPNMESIISTPRRLPNMDTHNESSFSFLFEPQFNFKKSNLTKNLLQRSESTTIKQNTKQLRKEDSLFCTLNCTSLLNDSRKPTTSYKDTLIDKRSPPNTFDFKPIFASTPKHYRDAESTAVNLTKSSHLSRHSYRNFKRLNIRNSRSRISQKHLKEVDTSQSDSIKHRTMSTRLFDAINESCTKLVKTVKSIFKPKATKDRVKGKGTRPSSRNDRSNSLCSYSFTEYMRKRDAAHMNEDMNNESQDVEHGNAEPCKTCNDTLLLKRKIISDDYLKETVKKLKIGINLYGCDFKKISKALWPREPYMTPEVLYNLYRKVILK